MLADGAYPNLATPMWSPSRVQSDTRLLGSFGLVDWNTADDSAGELKETSVARSSRVETSAPEVLGRTTPAHAASTLTIVNTKPRICPVRMFIPLMPDE